MIADAGRTRAHAFDITSVNPVIQPVSQNEPDSHSRRDKPNLSLECREGEGA